MYPHLQYISHAGHPNGHLQVVERACAAGVPWVQLRIKEASDGEVRPLAVAAQALCQQAGVVFVLNDRVELAQELGCGVHLGQQDTNPKTARELLGSNALIGGTADSFEAVAHMAAMGVDYIGLGPLRFTQTKAQLSPILGLEGYAQILLQCRTAGIDVPIYAIGGVRPEDAADLHRLGLYGLAVSGAITHSSNLFQTLHDLQAPWLAKMSGPKHF